MEHLTKEIVATKESTKAMK